MPFGHASSLVVVTAAQEGPKAMFLIVRVVLGLVLDTIQQQDNVGT